MQTFLGNIEAKLDVKGRVFVPSVYRKSLPEGERERLVARIDPDNECLVFYPESVWMRTVETLRDGLDEWDAEDRLLLMQYVADAEMLDVDAQGRVLVSKKYAAFFGESNEVVFVGMVDRFALWSRVSYEQSRLSRVDLAQKMRDKMKKRV